MLIKLDNVGKNLAWMNLIVLNKRN